MGDIFKEQIVKRQPSRKDMLIRIGLIIVVFLIILIVLAMPGLMTFAPIIVLAVIFGAWYAMSFLKVEYEYAFTDGELDIDVIYNRSRRKRVFSARVNDFIIMAHVEDTAHAGEFQGAQDFKDYSSGVVSADTYAFLTNYNGKRTKIIIDPNPVMLKAMAGVLTRRRLHVKL